MLEQVGTMEQQLEAAVRELAAMRRDLAEMERRRHPAANAMRKAVIIVQAQVLELREKLSALKQAIADGCKNAVTAFREKGAAALDTVTRFFRVRPMLEAVQVQADHAAQARRPSRRTDRSGQPKIPRGGTSFKKCGPGFDRPRKPYRKSNRREKRLRRQPPHSVPCAPVSAH